MNKAKHDEDAYKLRLSSLDGRIGDDHRTEMFLRIENLLNACYTFGINPLTHLRKLFPDYNWRWYGTTVLDTEAEIRLVVRQADYLWLAGGWHFVRATRISERPENWSKPILWSKDCIRPDAVQRILRSGAEIRTMNPALLDILKSEQMANVKIEDLKLSIRAQNCLLKAGYTTLGSFRDKSAEEMLAHHNFSKAAVREINKVMLGHGIHLCWEC